MFAFFPLETLGKPLEKLLQWMDDHRLFLVLPALGILLSLGVSGLAGYETVNWGEKSLYDGSTLRDEDGFIGGGAMTLEMETYLTDKIVLLLTGRERVLWGNSTGHFHLQFGVGIKFIIN